jgi:diguanylate cyclase (GGDEF)-like protein
MELRANAWKYVIAAGLSATALYFVVPGSMAKDVIYGAVGLASVICILVGIHVSRPENRWGWYLLAMGATCFTFGDSVGNAYALIFHQPDPFPSVADAFYLAGYPFIFAGVLRVSRNPGHSAKREDFADAAIVALGAVAISWHWVLSSYVHNPSLDAPAKFVALAYPVMNIALVFIVARSLIFVGSSRPCHKLLAAALVAMCLADFSYEVLALHHHFGLENPTYVFFLMAYALLGAAALHPSVGEAEPVPTRLAPNIYRRDRTGHRRIPFVALAGFVPPAILVIGAATGVSVDLPVMASLCMAVFALIFLRMMWLIGRISGQTQEIEQHALALQSSLTERETLESDLRHQAFHDGLTGLANRALLHDRVEHALAAAERSGSLVALCFGDLDGFKSVNDTLGHDVGDRVLVRASRLLSSIVRPGDTVARLGGDEFAVLMVNVDAQQSAVDFGHRVVSVLRDAPDFEGSNVALSISVGVAYATSGTTTEQLLSEADSAMYAAKEDGKNCVRVFQTSMRSRMVERLELINGFRLALARSEFVLHYQPIVDLASRRLRGFEALLRWNHPTLGEVAPSQFIPLAEETGFIVPLSRWILVEACERMSDWSREGAGDLVLSINLSRRQLNSPDLADEVRTALALSAIAPERLVLDITEDVLMEDPDQATRALSELRELGVRIAVDDFGTGYSSLSHLQRFPVDILKIDRSFIEPLTSPDAASAALVSAIIGLAESLGLGVIAEGIENDSQLQRLIELGCSQGQGLFVASPMDAEAGDAFVAQSSTDSALT